MGKMPGHRQATMYVESELWEQVRCAAYSLGEDIFEFVGHALRGAVDRRLTPDQKSAVKLMASQNLKHHGQAKRRRRRG